jgi:hypothetical protein
MIILIIDGNLLKICYKICYNVIFCLFKTLSFLYVDDIYLEYLWKENEVK